MKLFKENIEIIVKRIIGFYFHLKNYSNNPKMPDEHLANIVKNP